MTLKRRDFINLSSIVVASSIVSSFSSCKSNEQKEPPKLNESMKLLTDDVVPISLEERHARIAKAQRLLQENKMEALLLDAGTGMNYFTGVSWWPSERTMVALIPASGEIKYVCPTFEEDRVREKICIGKEIHSWQEDESPYELIYSVLQEMGIHSGTIAMEENSRFFIHNGLKKVAPQFRFESGDPITIPCRIIKSEAEIKLMQKANDITLEAMKRSVEKLKEGLSQDELSAMILSEQNALGGNAAFALCLFDKASAYPHGTKQQQALKKGDIVLMDCGCTVEGYNSDITRTIVFGAEPTKRQKTIWELEKRAQEAGFAAAKIGAPCEAVDIAARKVLTDAGFGPGYKLPGLPHRTGHGIGMDGHEWGNMVKGNQQLLEPGMCFSIEPTIAIAGEFGVRLEDCLYMTKEGPKWFSQPSKSIYEPWG
jgi:Xaa-Pro dipeptidase